MNHQTDPYFLKEYQDQQPEPETCHECGETIEHGSEYQLNDFYGFESKETVCEHCFNGITREKGRMKLEWIEVDNWTAEYLNPLTESLNCRHTINLFKTLGNMFNPNK